MAKHPAVLLISKLVSRLKFPQLFFLASGLFLVDLVVPDMIPFLDELLLAVLAVLFGMWQQDDDHVPQGSGRRAGSKPAEKNITPTDPP